MRNILIAAVLVAGSSAAMAQVTPTVDPNRSPMPVPQEQTPPDGVEPPSDTTPAPLPDTDRVPDSNVADPTNPDTDPNAMPDGTTAPPTDQVNPDGTTPPVDDPSTPGEGDPPVV